MPIACNSFSNLLFVYIYVCSIPSRIVWFVQFLLESSVTFRIFRWSIFHSIRWKIERARKRKTRRNIQDFPPEYFPPTKRSLRVWLPCLFLKSPTRNCRLSIRIPLCPILYGRRIESTPFWQEGLMQSTFFTGNTKEFV